MIEIIISENDDNDGRPHREGVLNFAPFGKTCCEAMVLFTMKFVDRDSQTHYFHSFL